MRFDRTAGDIFAIQDEISVQVTRALEVSLTPGAMERMRRRGTTNLEAYLEFLQGHALLATHRIKDAKAALARFQQAVALDPKFASAYLGIAEAALFAAEFEITDDRQRRFDTARRRGELLVEKALAIDPEHGEAYLQRAHLEAYENLASAERDFRRGLELSPNSAEGHAGLAEVLYASLPRRGEALELLERARKLDPLEPAYDVRMAVYLYDERSDPEAARELLVDVVARHPRYAPAVARLCESNFLVGDVAEAIRHCEEALALDPLLEESRRFLIHQYLLLGRPEIAELLVGNTGDEPDLRSIPILIDRRDWVRAGEVAYRALQQRTTSPSARWYACSAIRMHARTTGDYTRAAAALEAESGITWDANGNPVIPDQPTGVRDPAIALADVLIQAGQEKRGRRLLAAILARMRHETGELGRAEYWYVHFHPAALAMNGERDAAIDMLERSMAQSAKPVIAWWQLFEIEPAFATLREDPRFEAFRAKVRAHIAAQRRELERLRADGLLPDRPARQQSGGSSSAPAMHTTVASGNFG
jgi:tetratricopeptide (TPR) repeat protein